MKRHHGAILNKDRNNTRFCSAIMITNQLIHLHTSVFHEVVLPEVSRMSRMSSTEPWFRHRPEADHNSAGNVKISLSRDVYLANLKLCTLCLVRTVIKICSSP